MPLAYHIGSVALIGIVGITPVLLIPAAWAAAENIEYGVYVFLGVAPSAIKYFNLSEVLPKGVSAGFCTVFAASCPVFIAGTRGTCAATLPIMDRFAA